jgi:hypothetical protein
METKKCGSSNEGIENNFLDVIPFKVASTDAFPFSLWQLVVNALAGHCHNASSPTMAMLLATNNIAR